MNILFLSSYFHPEQAASFYLWENLREAFADRGYNMELYAPTPTRGITNETREEYKRKKYEEFYNGRLKVKRFSMIREGKSPLQRAFRYLLCNIRHCYSGCNAKTVDIIFVGSTPPTQGWIATKVKRKLKVPFVYCLQDIFPDSLVGTGITKKKSLLWKIGRKIEDDIYKNADKIIVISEDFKKNIIEKGVPESKIEVIYNWVDEKAVVPISRNENKLFDELGLSRDLFYIVYAGNLGHAQNIDIIIDAANELSTREDIRFVIFGSGGSEKELKGKAAKLNLKNLTFFPIQPSERISEVYSLGNAAIVTCKPGLGKSAMPSKTWSIMSSGTAILANFDEETELQKIIETQKIGLFSKAGDVEKFSDAIVNLYENSERCLEFGKNGRNFILKNLTKEVGTSKYIDVINNLLNNRTK